MTGDQRIGPGRLEKIICQRCGVAANKHSFSEKELETLYGEAYELNTLGHEEHIFYTQNGSISRSQVFADWVAPHIPSSAKEILEIGCGEGLLLGKLQTQFPDKAWSGIDGSHKAASMAKEKGLQVNQGLILNDQSSIPEQDVIMLINVIEHIENIDSFIELLKKRLRSNGRIVFCLPIQDFGGYDLAFAEHVWHFTTKHFLQLLTNHKLAVVHHDANHPINHGIGLFICEKSEAELPQFDLEQEAATIKNGWQKWDAIFAHVKEKLDQLDGEPIAVFGSGEVLTLLITFCDIKHRIAFVLDETPSKIGTTKHEIPVFHPEKLGDSSVKNVLITTNPKYFEQVSEKLKKYGVNCIDIAG